MKRKVLLILLASVLVAMIPAQGTERGQRESRRPAPEAVTISGSMVVVNGFPALKSGDVTYFVGGINRLIGFVDGLKEGAQVTVEGFVFSGPKEGTVKFLRPSKLSLNGKSYDFATPGLNQNPGEGGNGFWRGFQNPQQGFPRWQPMQPRQFWQRRQPMQPRQPMRQGQSL